MSLLNIQEKHIRPAVFASVGIYILFAALFFSPIQIPHKITFTVGSAFVAALWLCPWQMCMALLFSALGDYFGSCHNFLAQMGFFALGHIFYIWFFIRRWLTKVEADKKLTAKVKGQIFVFLLLIAALMAVVFTKIVPCSPTGVIRTGVSIYAVLISTMLFFALLQRSSLYALGAVLFVFSDFILAWNKFVGPVEHRDLLVMTTYFMGQLLLFVRSTPYRIRSGARTMRF